MSRRRGPQGKLDNSECAMGHKEQTRPFGSSWPLDAELAPGHLREKSLLEVLEIDREESHSHPSPQTT